MLKVWGSRATDVIVDVAGREDARLQDAVVISVIDNQESSGSDQRPEVTERPAVLGQTALEVWER